jgi:iron complex outermembrane recepter protein
VKKAIRAVSFCVALGAWAGIAAAQQSAPDTVALNISRQPLARALADLAVQANLNLVYYSELGDGLQAPELVGRYAPDAAVRLLLKNSPLYADFVDAHTVVIRGGPSDSDQAGQNVPQGGERTGAVNADSKLIRLAELGDTTQVGLASEENVPSENELAEESPNKIEEVLVTGTYLHNTAPITPLITITHDDLISQGYTRLDEAFEQLPQNFTAGASQNSNPVNGAGNNASNNYSYASGVNLRGLGASATLVLLNGRRLAPTAVGGVTDISQIPVSIIDRVEILTDGASALYGSDAVAGVVNVITRKDYSGFELSGRATSITQGKAPDYDGDMLGGFAWNGGGIVLSFDHEKQNPLFARNRSFVGTGLPDPYALTPNDESSHYYASLHQEFSDRLNLALDTLVTQRSFTAQNRLSPTDPTAYAASGHVDQYNTSLQLDYKVSSEWTATVVGQASKETDKDLTVYASQNYVTEDSPFDYQVYSFEPKIDGKVFSAPGGAARLALGAQVRRESFKDVYANGMLAGPLTIQQVIDTSRHIDSAYAELLLPIVGSENALPFVQRLRIDLAGRYDHYSDFGSTSNPKIALEWAPASGLALHSSYARSFQAPTLWQASNALNYGYVQTIPDPKAPSGSSIALLIDGTNPNLKPETARSFNAGLTYEPTAVKGLKFDASYFSIDFTNEINRLFFQYSTNALQQEAALGSLIERNPPLTQVTQELENPGRTILNADSGYCTVGTSGCPAIDPSTIQAIANLGYENASSVRVGGIDFTASYNGEPTAFGRFHADLNSTYFTTYQQRAAPASSEQSQLNTVYNPLKFRAKANLGWQNGGLGGNVRINYSNAYNNSIINTTCSSDNTCGVASWTTVDASLSYTVPARNGGSLFEGIRVNLDVTNVFNRKPPLVIFPAGYLLQYDATNANPFLRTFGLAITKSWGGGH